MVTRPPPRIEDYGAIGNGRSVALVSRAGSVEWLCWPRPDSPSLFAALLDSHEGGRFSISPTGAHAVQRQYVPYTNVLETRFSSAGGALTLVDLMPVAAEQDKGLYPEHELLRYAKCESGEVEVEVVFDARPDYARRRARLEDGGLLGWRFNIGPALVTLRSSTQLERQSGGTARALVRLRAGESLEFSLTYSDTAPAVLPPLGDRTQRVIEQTVSWWRMWARSIRYHGPNRDEVIRSALALKLLVYAPSGAVVAAATTSLPERVGGDLNFDYRYSWLRDASFTFRALEGLGLEDEGAKFVDWLIHATALTRPELKILYDVFGKQPVAEHELKHLSGYRGSRPVQVGNAAAGQVQLDVYGEVVDAVTQLCRRTGRLDRLTRRMLREFGEYVCRHWEQPDAGIWETRGEGRQFTHSKAMCWVVLDRLLELHERGLLKKIPVEKFKENRRLLREKVDQYGWSERLNSFSKTLDDDEVDASLLLLGWYGYEPPSSARMKSTCRVVQERLAAGPGLLYRNHEYEEGAFGICGFWAAELVARGAGSLDAAQELFRKALAHANDLSLFGEQIDPDTGGALGNFPQAFTHVGLINAALSIQERIKEEEERRGNPRREPEHQEEAQP